MDGVVHRTINGQLSAGNSRYSDNIPQRGLDEVAQLILGYELKERWTERIGRGRRRRQMRQKFHVS